MRVERHTAERNSVPKSRLKHGGATQKIEHKLHDLTNKLQAVLSYLEMQKCPEALCACQSAVQELQAVLAELIVLRGALNEEVQRDVEGRPG